MGDATSVGTTTIAAGAEMLMFDYGDQSAINRQITISANANAYLFEDARVSMQGEVHWSNDGTFTAVDTTALLGDNTSYFDNNGIFVVGSSTVQAAITVALPFNNAGQVNLLGGTLTLRSGTSTAGWSLANGTGLIFNGQDGQSYVFDTGTSVSYPTAPANQTLVGGAVIINGAGSGGLTVQSGVSINQLELSGGNLGGLGMVTVTGQMLWYNGTMDFDAINPGGPNPLGTLTIASHAALFLIGDQPAAPVLGRPLDIRGYVGWVGNDGSVDLTRAPSAAVISFTNTVTMLNTTALADIPAPSSWANMNQLKGGYGSPTEMVQALQQVFAGRIAVLPDSWAGITIAPGSSVTDFLRRLPAIERASIALAFALNSGPIQNYTGVTPAIRDLLLTGQQAVTGGVAQLRNVTLVSSLQFAAGLVAGIGQGALNQISGTFSALGGLVRGLVTNPLGTVNSMYNGAVQLVALMLTPAGRTQILQTMFADLITAANLWDRNELVSFAGGRALGKALSGIVVQIASTYLTAGAAGLLTAATNYVRLAITTAARTTIQVTTALITRVAALARPVLAVASILTRPLAAIMRVGASIARALPAVAARINNAVNTAFCAITARTAIIGNNCFPPDTLVATETGLRPIGKIRTGDRVFAFDFTAGRWALTHVLERHGGRYHGLMVKVQTGRNSFEATAQHPIWVVEGSNLDERPPAGELQPQEDEGRSLPGRWVNAEDLRAGDLVYCQDGQTRRVSRVEHREVDCAEICNLTIRAFHSFAVGPNSVLVHNLGCWGKVLQNVARIAIPQSVKDFAVRMGATLSQIHGHHIVMKAIRGAAKYWNDRSRVILRRNGIGLLDTTSDARLAAAAYAANGTRMYNLCWALNATGDWTIHSAAYARAVFTRLRRAELQGGAAAVRFELNAMAEQLSIGFKFWS